MKINFENLSGSQRYHVMSQIIVPRPIAWVLTKNDDEQSYNLAPFSYFNAISSEPPLVVLSVGSKPSGEIKDSRHNIVNNERCVIHIPSVADAKHVSDTAATLDYGDSEVEKLGLTLIEEDGWSLPRLKDCRVAMACHLYDVKEIGPNKQGIIFCQIDDVYVHDGATTVDDKGRVKVNANSIEPLSRLGANEYASFGDVFSVARPK